MFDEVNFNQSCISSRYGFLQKSTRSDETFFLNKKQVIYINSKCHLFLENPNISVKFDKT